MDQNKTGRLIRALRQGQNLTQAELGEKLGVGGKAVSKWECGAGAPDIALLPRLSELLGVDTEALLRGELGENAPSPGNLRRMRFYACPDCGNLLFSLEGAEVSCCGRKLPALTPRRAGEGERLSVTLSDGDWYVAAAHPMTREHHIRFIAYVTSDRTELVRLYPEGAAQARFLNRGRGKFFWCCNRHGLYTAHYGRKPKI